MLLLSVMGIYLLLLNLEYAVYGLDLAYKIMLPAYLFAAFKAYKWAENRIYGKN